MKKKSIIITIIESIYLIYMYNFFKTKYSFHHPLEYLIEKGNISFIKHPINTGNYESKICPLGKLVSFGLTFWIWYRFFLVNFLSKKLLISINYIIFITVLIFSLLMNINSFIYYIPIYIYELFFFRF